MEHIDLGKCCGCQKQGEDVRNILSLPYKAPEQGGSSWGCFVCGLPSEGAIAVLCDECLEADRIEEVVVGYAYENKRINYEEFKTTAEPHEHDFTKHPELHEAN